LAPFGFSIAEDDFDYKPLVSSVQRETHYFLIFFEQNNFVQGLCLESVQKAAILYEKKANRGLAHALQNELTEGVYGL
jgi:hypothetical protein